MLLHRVSANDFRDWCAGRAIRRAMANRYATAMAAHFTDPEMQTMGKALTRKDVQRIERMSYETVHETVELDELERKETELARVFRRARQTEELMSQMADKD